MSGETNANPFVGGSLENEQPSAVPILICAAYVRNLLLAEIVRPGSPANRRVEGSEAAALRAGTSPLGAPLSFFLN